MAISTPSDTERAIGFSGLGQMVSRVDLRQLAALSAPAVVEPAATARPDEPRAFEPPPKAAPLPKAVQIGLVAGGLVMLLAFCTLQSPKTASSNAPDAGVATTAEPAASAPSAYDPASAPAASDAAAPAAAPTEAPTAAPAGYAEESRPQAGDDLALSEGEIRYCLNEGVRIDSAKTAIDRANDAQIDRYNEIIKDFNGRCIKYRYHQADYDRAQAAMNADRERLEAEGVAKIQ